MSARHFGDLIYKKRKSIGMRQEKLAAILKITQGTVSKIESGLASPTLVVASRAAKELNISPARMIQEILRK